MIRDVKSEIRAFAERRIAEVWDRGTYVVLVHRKPGGKGTLKIFVPKILDRRGK